MKIFEKESAFPSVGVSDGINVRQYFAAMALQGLCAVNDKVIFETDELCMAKAAKLSVMAADALINELNK